MSFELVDSMLKHGPARSIDKLVLVVIASFANARSGRCDPSMSTIGARASLTERAARSVIRRLENDGWLAVDRGGGRSGCSTYRINPERGSPFTGVKPGSSRTKTRKLAHENPERGSVNPERGSPEPVRTKKENQEGEPTKAASGSNRAGSVYTGTDDQAELAARLFDAIWRGWPKKTGRAEAWKSLIDALAAGAVPAEIARGAAAYIADRQRDSRGPAAVIQYTTPLARWLADGAWAAWLDLPEAEQRAAQMQEDAGRQRRDWLQERAAQRAALPF